MYSARSDFSFSSVCPHGISSPRAGSHHDVIRRNRHCSSARLRALSADLCDSKSVGRAIASTKTSRSHTRDLPTLRNQLRKSYSVSPRCDLQAHPEDRSIPEKIGERDRCSPTSAASQAELEDQAVLQKGYENCQHAPVHVTLSRSTDHFAYHDGGKARHTGSDSSGFQCKSAKLAVLRDSCARAISLIRTHSADVSISQKIREHSRHSSKSKVPQANSAANSVDRRPPCLLGSNSRSLNKSHLMRDRSATEYRNNEVLEYPEYPEHTASAELGRIQASRAAATALLCQKQDSHCCSLENGQVTLRQRKQSLLCHSGSLTARARMLVRPPLSKADATDKVPTATAVDRVERDSNQNLDRRVAEIVATPPVQTIQASLATKRPLTKERRGTNRGLKHAMSSTVIEA
eukprot:TRINITY_DN80376_c0_g1_i1.p1 TRINITY_DN80376_c0_g1~~TRINITY_DN80376_c0_g1_i1.p1  ORF type:complete len:444 (+),score=32.78 TRINITY_DN80376_c0_g1_i1:120-1334(+)